MNCTTTSRSCGNEEKKMLSKIHNERALQEIAQKTSEVAHLKRMVKEEAMELKCLRVKNQELANQIAPVQARYKEGKSTLQQFEECINQRKIKAQGLEAKIFKLEKKICNTENDQAEFNLEQDRMSTMGSGKLSILQRQDADLQEKLKSLKKDYCNQTTLTGTADDKGTQLAVAEKETAQMTDQAEHLEECLKKLEAEVHEIADCNQRKYDEIKQLEENCIPSTIIEITKLQQVINQQREDRNFLEEKRQEHLAKNEELSQNTSQDCTTKTKLTSDLRDTLLNCQKLKERHQKGLELEEKLLCKIECLKQQNKQLLQKSSSLKKSIQNRECQNL